jgi:stage III sporulation protein AF
MTGSVGQWVLALVAVALVVALLDALTPEGSARRVMRLAGGLLLLVIMLRPLNALVGLDFSALVEEFAQQDNGQETDLEDTNRALLESLTVQSTQAYIQRQGALLGVECRATVTCQWQEDLPVPWEVELMGHWTEESQTSLSARIAEDLGISAEHQSYKEGDP